MSEVDEVPKLIDREKVRDMLFALQDQIGERRPKIQSFDNYAKETFLAFDSYNLGLTTAMGMIGQTIKEILELESQPQKESLNET